MGVALSILSVTLVTYWKLDFYFLRSYLLYTYSPYAVLLWALGAISTNPKEGDLALKGATRTFVYVLIGVTVFVTVCKIVMGIVMAIRGSNDKTASEVESLKQDTGVSG